MKEDIRDQSSSIPRLDSAPYEIQQTSLNQRNIRSTQPPLESILDGEANMPCKTTPGYNAREQVNNSSRNYDDGHRLGDI
jgi:hypothetical protein